MRQARLESCRHRKASIRGYLSASPHTLTRPNPLKPEYPVWEFFLESQF